MTYEFAKYPDGILGVFSNIGKKEKFYGNCKKWLFIFL